MNRKEFIRHIATIMYHEGWQTKKGRVVLSSVAKQKTSINAIAKALDIQKLSTGEVVANGFG